MGQQPAIAVIGAGIGGLALAGFLTRQGMAVTVYEQARRFERIGAGIQMSPNAMRVLRALALEAGLRARAFEPPTWSHRVWDTGETLSDMDFGPHAERQYGAPYLLMHRGDLHEALHSAVPQGCVVFEKRLAGLNRAGSTVILSFADGSTAQADAVNHDLPDASRTARHFRRPD